MKRFYITILSALLVFLSGCAILKTAKLMKAGSVRETTFKTEVPFEMRYGLIVLKVTIHGKEYSFLLDTGAPNVISKKLAQQLGIKTVTSRKAGDSQGNKSSLGFTSIDSIGIGGLQFLSTGAAIADLEHSSEIACFHLDGFIGANLMRKAVWQFDYERNIITITNDRHSLIIPSNALTIKFKQALSGTPRVDLQLNGQIEGSVGIDLGSNGDFNCSEETFKTLKKKDSLNYSYTYGFGSSGLYGRGGQDTSWHAIISTIQMDSLKLFNQVVTFRKKAAKIVGTNFFRNYRLIFDWSLNELTLIPVKPYENTTEKSFLFSFILKDQQVFIGSTHYKENEGFESLKLGDQVLEMDGKNFRTCSIDNYCLLFGRRFENSDTDISLLVKRGDKELNIKVAKETVFLNH
ncbi:retropepsin-like aspartic protease [Aurantibacillus circumpalustris]|uniref:retropepsin-like aspartic protease n=1 Tax=Aurantibacillus circumpalustris TaxID=3036359 RepID=UPI00295A802D|nr:retropepsin-like aspartic protease [Aurantibacillus circumpalustris]